MRNVEHRTRGTEFAEHTEQCIGNKMAMRTESTIVCLIDPTSALYMDVYVE
jgi:hypothetical protein